MIPSEVTVRAGETTTVDLGVPVDANYSGGGWTVTSNGRSRSPHPMTLAPLRACPPALEG